MDRFEDETCDKNFECAEHYTEGPLCVEYYRGEKDIDCHIPCLTKNCSVQIVKRHLCSIYNCIGKLDPASIVTNHLPVIIGISAFALGFLLCTVVSFICWRRWKARLTSLGDRDNLLETENPNSPIIRDQELRVISMNSLLGESPSAPPVTASPPPPAYDDIAGACARPNLDNPINSYKESLACLEEAYKKVRSRTPRELFRPEDVANIIITTLIPASAIDAPRHDLLATSCSCYECFLLNLELTMRDNEKETKKN